MRGRFGEGSPAADTGADAANANPVANAAEADVDHADDADRPADPDADPADAADAAPSDVTLRSRLRGAAASSLSLSWSGVAEVGRDGSDGAESAANLLAVSAAAPSASFNFLVAWYVCAIWFVSRTQSP